MADLVKRRVAIALLGLALAFQPGCMTAYRKSVGATLDQSFTKVFVTDLNTAWQAVLEALKSFRLDVSDREAGYLQTRWTDNTSERNLVDSFGGSAIYLKAQYRFRINLDEGFFAGQKSIRLTVQREQMIQRDVLEGWRPVETDGIEEQTLLYRLERLISMRTRLAQLEKERLEKEIQSTPNF
jgi:hypothetical protein